MTDGADYSNIVFTDLSGCTAWIEGDEHDTDEDYEYTIKIAWMTDEEIENLPEANF